MDKIFNSRDTRYKLPYGAVPMGTSIEFHLRPPRSLATTGARLCATFEQSNMYYEVEMQWRRSEDHYDEFAVELETGSYIGLIWYYFRIETNEGTRFVDNAGISCAHNSSMQITVYEPKFIKAPWFSEGIVYQIFPDRFCRTGIPEAPPRKRIHQDWNELPEFWPDIDHKSGQQLWNNDFYGGDLAGIASKLDYLKSLGVSVIYLNPIFEAFSNHRYDTASYERIDPLLGDNSDFVNLCDECHSRGIKVILDGVFNHTGSDSVYFNRHGTYPSVGASQSLNSPYYSWFDFKAYPDSYSSWWGIDTLPAVNEMDPTYMDYIIRGDQSIIKRWLLSGADGWRLDVADELPDDFVREINTAAKSVKSDAIVLGEVWEDASTKISYDVRRRHLWGGYLDGVMNYPLRQSIIDYLLGGSSNNFRDEMETIRENYPREAFYSSLNFLGTHDTARILSVLAQSPNPGSREDQSKYQMSEIEYTIGKRRLKLASLILFTFPGVPTIYYGDEAGVNGFQDPFNRTTYPWGNEDMELVSWYRHLGLLRQSLIPLRQGEISYFITEDAVLAYSRQYDGESVYTIINSGEEAVSMTLPWDRAEAVDVISGRSFNVSAATVEIYMDPLSCVLIAREHVVLTYFQAQ